MFNFNFCIMKRNLDIQFVDAYTTKIVFGSKNRVIVVKSFEVKTGDVAFPSMNAFHVYFLSIDEGVALHGILNQNHYGLVKIAYHLFQGYLDVVGDRFNLIRYAWFILTKRCVSAYPTLPISVCELEKFVSEL